MSPVWEFTEAEFAAITAATVVAVDTGAPPVPGGPLDRLVRASKSDGPFLVVTGEDAELIRTAVDQRT